MPGGCDIFDPFQAQDAHAAIGLTPGDVYWRTREPVQVNGDCKYLIAACTPCCDIRGVVLGSHEFGGMMLDSATDGTSGDVVLRYKAELPRIECEGWSFPTYLHITYPMRLWLTGQDDPIENGLYVPFNLRTEKLWHDTCIIRETGTFPRCLATGDQTDITTRTHCPVYPWEFASCVVASDGRMWVHYDQWYAGAGSGRLTARLDPPSYSHVRFYVILHWGLPILTYHTQTGHIGGHQVNIPDYPCLRAEFTIEDPTLRRFDFPETLPEPTFSTTAYGDPWIFPSFSLGYFEDALAITIMPDNTDSGCPPGSVTGGWHIEGDLNYRDPIIRVEHGFQVYRKGPATKEIVHNPVERWTTTWWWTPGA